ncbi:MAG: SDH family Clp fold serine proteinase [Candidatus Thorarchaeota archaeon]
MAAPTSKTGVLAAIAQEHDTVRRHLLDEIERITGNNVIAYVANPNASPNFIDRNDPVFFADLLRLKKTNETLDLIIDSPGGEPQVAEQLAQMLRHSCRSLRVIVPNVAKSAATMIALASDRILMGYVSELGPIDPQLRLVTPSGQTVYMPAQSILDSVGMMHSMLAQGVDQRVVLGLLRRIEPPLLDVANKSIQFSKRFAEEWLSKYMLKHDHTKASDTAAKLADNNRWLLHGKRIGVEEAKELGLAVEFLPPNGKLWMAVWEYYCRAFMHLNNTGAIKLFECKEQSMNFSMGIRRAGDRRQQGGEQVPGGRPGSVSPPASRQA